MAVIHRDTCPELSLKEAKGMKPIEAGPETSTYWYEEGFGTVEARVGSRIQHFN